jgi:hypothetical protein
MDSDEKTTEKTPTWKDGLVIVVLTRLPLLGADFENFRELDAGGGVDLLGIWP